MHCVASNCLSSEGQGVKLFCFPRDAARRALWATKVNRIGWKPTICSCLCEKHFELDQFELDIRDNVKNLQPFAVPTLFDYTSNGELETVTVRREALIATTERRKVCVTNTKPVKAVMSSLPTSDTVTNDVEPTEILPIDVLTEDPRLLSLVEQLETVQKQKDARLTESKEFYIMKERVRQLLRDIDSKQNNIQKDLAERVAEEKLIQDRAVELCGGDIQKWRDVVLKVKDSKQNLVNAHDTQASPEQPTIHVALPVRVNGPLVQPYPVKSEKLKTDVPTTADSASASPSKHCSAPQVGQSLPHSAAATSILSGSSVATEVGTTPSTSSQSIACVEPSSSENNSREQSTVTDNVNEAGSLVIASTVSLANNRSAAAAYASKPTPVETFLCDLCGASFTVKKKWRYHVSGHEKSGDKMKFACSICDKLFINSYRLRVHQRTHTGECPFMCQECGRSFYKKELFTLHRRIHSDERPVACKKCSATFKRRDALHRHMLKEHEPHRLLTCNFCESRFVLPCHLRSHLERVHLDDKKQKRDDARKVKKRKRPLTSQTVEMTCELSCHEEIVVYVGDGLEDDSSELDASDVSQNQSGSELE